MVEGQRPIHCRLVGSMRRCLPNIRFILYAASVLCFVGLRSAPALTIVDFDATLHDVYQSDWGTTSPVPNANPSFVGAGLDFSGVGWNGTRNVALISDTHLAYASHFPAAESYEFFSPISGQSVTYYVDAVAGSSIPNSDIRIAPIFQDENYTIAGLDAADGITSYSIATWPAPGDFVGADLLVYGRGPDGPRLGTDIVEGIIIAPSDPPYLYIYTQGTEQGEAFLETGDSGGPSFVVVEGQRTFAGIHYAIDPDNEPFPLSADSYFAVYESDIDGLGVGATFTLIPEPSATSLALAALIWLAGWMGMAWWKRRPVQ